MILYERSGHKNQTGFLSAMVVQVYVLVILPLLVQGHPIHFHCHEAAPDAQASCDKRVSACYGRVSSLTPCKFSAYGLPTELDELLYTGNSFQAVDWDGDGDLDLLVATPQGPILQYERVANDLLIRNHNATQFHRIEIPKSNFKVNAQDVFGWIGPKFQGIDWDNDGDLDLLAFNRDHTLFGRMLRASSFKISAEPTLSRSLRTFTPCKRLTGMAMVIWTSCLAHILAFMSAVSYS